MKQSRPLFLRNKLLRNCLSMTVLAVLFGACSRQIKIPDANESLRSDPPEKAWARVLSRYVDTQGRVNFEELAKHPEDLHHYVRYVSETSPDRHPDKFPTREERIAFYLNSYNALSMYNIIDAGVPESLSGLKKFNIFFLRKFTIGGEVMSLYRYESDFIRKQGEERVHFALNCMSVGCPILPQKPFEGASLNKTLDEAAEFFFSEARNLRIDTEKKKLFLSEILKFYTDDFLKKAPSLNAYVNLHRKEKVPLDYDVEFIPYDWTVNRQPKELT